jgi:WD40 repeat protein
MIRKSIAITALIVITLIACNSGPNTDTSNPATNSGSTPAESVNRSQGTPPSQFLRDWNFGNTPSERFGNINSLVWSKNTTDLIVGADLGLGRIDAVTGKTINSYSPNQYVYQNAIISPDETLIIRQASRDSNDTSPINALEPGTQFTQPQGVTIENTRPFAWNQTGTMIAGIKGDYADAGVAIWDVKTGTVQKTLISNDAYSGLRWSNDGTFLLTSSYSREKSNVIDINTGLIRCTVKLSPSELYGQPRYFASWESAKISGNSNYFAILFVSGNLYNYRVETRIYNASDCSRFKTITIPTPYSYSFDFAWSADSSSLAVYSYNFGLDIYDFATGNKKWHSNRYATKVAWSPDGSKLAVGEFDYIHTLDAFTGLTISEISRKPIENAQGNIYGLGWSPDGQRVIDTSRDRRAIIRKSSNGQPLAELGDGLIAHAGSIYAVAYAPNGGKIATSDSEGIIKLWDAATNAALSTLNGHTYTVRSLAWSPNSNTLASGSWDSTIKLWDANSGLETKTLTGHTDFVNVVTYNPAGTRLASASSDKSIKIWSPTSTAAPLTLSGHTGSVFALAWSPDGARLASGSADRSVKIWNVTTGTVERTIEAINFFVPVRGLVWSKDGSRLISSSEQFGLQIWDVNTGKQVAVQYPDSPPFSIALSPDGSQLLVGSTTGRVTRWVLQ